MPEIPAEAVQAAAKASSMHFAFCDEPRWQDCAECVRVMERMERGLKAAAPSLAEQIAREIERVVASGEYLRPKYERGGFFNDARWSAKVAREAFTPVQGLVKECPQTATESTESAETPTSRVSVPPEGAEGITESRGADARAVIAPETRSAFEADPPEEHQPQSPPQSDLRRRYADALSRSLTSPQRGMADHLDAVLAVRDDELADAVRRAEQAEAKLAAAAELADQRAFPVSRGDGDGTGTWRYAVDAAELDRIIEHDPAGAGQPNAGPAGDSGGPRPPAVSRCPCW